MLNIAKHVKLVLPPPLTQFVRYKQSFTRKPRAPHFGAQMIARVVEPKYPPRFDKHFPQHLRCRKPIVLANRDKYEENPLENILAKEIKDVARESKMLLIIHKNPSSNHVVFKTRMALKREKMALLTNAKSTFELAFADTKYAPILELFSSHTLVLASPVPDVYTAYSILESRPFLVLLAGVIEDKFVDRRTLDVLGKLPDLTAARAQLAHTLITPAMMLAQNINLYGESLEPDSK